MVKTRITDHANSRIARLAVVFLPGLLLILWLGNTPPGLLGKADAIGYAVCHRIDLRSFHIAGRQLPLCARCSGMYLGAMLGLAFQIFKGRMGGMPPRKIMIVLAGLVLVFVIDGVNSFLSLVPGFPTLYEPNNSLRLISGTGMGLVIAALLLPAFNEVVWRNWDPRPAVGEFRSLGWLLLLGAILDLVVLSERPQILYPLALISAAGVVVLLTMIYSMLWLMILKRENQYQHMREMFFPVIAGFSVALFQIALLDLGRYLLTGTWQGFHFG